MRVLFIAHSFPRFPGDAAGSFLHRLAIALRKEKVDVSVIAPAARGVAEFDNLAGIAVERFRYAPRTYETLAYTGTMAQDVSASWTAKLAMIGFMGAGFASGLGATRRLAPDIIHAHWWFPSGVFAAAISRLSRIPLVTTMHGTDVRFARAVGASRPLFRGVMRRSAQVTTVSSWLASEVSAMLPGVVPRVAPMPVATERFAPAGKREQRRFLFAGRLNEQKGLKHLLSAMTRLEHDVTLDVVGDGPDSESLRSVAVENGIAARIVWHGQLHQDGLLQLYQRATALVVPSTDEGLGLVAAEGLMCETPVIAFRSGGLTDVIEHERTGLLVPPGDADALAAAMQRILSRSDEALSFGKAGRTSALSAFSPEASARQYAGIYEEALGRA
ncbi:MAG: glycosyltransferase [Gemmatimonadaceae bacterium]